MEQKAPLDYAVMEHRPINFAPLPCGMSLTWFSSITCGLLLTGFIIGEMVMAVITAACLIPPSLLITSRDPFGWRVLYNNTKVKRVLWA